MPDLTKLKWAAKRIVPVLITMIFLVVSASAYTVVMHGGKRIEIPSHFVVTSSTFTYEVGDGIQVTLQMAAIDIPATDKANNEQPGSLLRRVQSAAAGTSAPKSVGATRTITNRDLEASMRRRRESELAYEIRRKELGLPSLEESRKKAAAELDESTREVREWREAESQTEDYWRTRANTLRTEMTALDAEVNYMRVQLEEGPFSAAGGSFTTVGSIGPFISFGRFGSALPFPGSRSMAQRPNVFTPRGGAQLTGRVGFGGGATRGHIFVNPGGFRPARPFGGGFPGATFPRAAVFGSAIQPYDFSYEGSALITRFNELAAARAGLNARWRELEDEARRAGAPPGWLRP